MERLTEWNKDHTHGQAGNVDCITRLCEIEDILGPTYNLSRLRELVEADRETLVVVLPAKYVYEIHWCPGPDCDGICLLKIDGIPCCDLCDYAVEKVAKVECRQEHLDKIGKTVFLTYEECDAYQREGGNPRAETDQRGQTSK